MTNSRLYPALLILIGAGSLVTAFTAQFGFGLEPCILCLYQRVPFAIVIALGAVGVWKPQALAWVFALAAFTFATGAAIAVYHFGVEQHWWVSAAGCGGKLPTQISPADLMASLNTKPPKACDAVEWTLFGVSIAGWNVVFSSTLAALSFYVLRTRQWEK